jgi:hypothetical protein
VSSSSLVLSCCSCSGHAICNSAFQERLKYSLIHSPVQQEERVVAGGPPASDTRKGDCGILWVLGAKDAMLGEQSDEEVSFRFHT